MERLTPPAEVPVDLAQLRAHLRLEEGEEDGHLQHCLDVAVAQFDGDDGELGLALVLRPHAIMRLRGLTRDHG